MMKKRPIRLLIIVATGSLGVLICAYYALAILFGTRSDSSGGAILMSPASYLNGCGDRCLIQSGKLSTEWSERLPLPGGHGQEVHPLEPGATAEVRLNGDDKYRYTIDFNNVLRRSDGVVMSNGFYAPEPGFAAQSVEVRAADSQSVGKGFSVFAAKNR